MPARIRNTVTSYLVAILAVAAASALTGALGPLARQNQFVLYVVAVMLVAWWRGLGPGILTTVLGTFAINYFFMPPLFDLDFGSEDAARMTLFFIIALSITALTEARKRAQEQARLRQASLAHVARLATLNELASGIAHELNQPLAAIAIYSEGTLEKLRAAPAADPDLIQAMEATVAQAARAARIINHYQEFARRREPRRVSFDIAATIRSALQLVNHEFQRHNISVDLRLADLPPVSGDPVEIEQVVVNLLRNAADAMAAAAGLSHRLVIYARTGAFDRVCIDVVDNGPGVPPADLPHVFEPFFTTRDRGLGLGLGLPISRSIIEAHGGGLTLHTSPAGTIAAFTLPAALEHPSPAPSPAATLAPAPAHGQP